MKTGMFFGSFNPIHAGHLIIANYMLEFTDLQEVWFVVSPQNPFKQDQVLAPDTDRLEMVRLAINGQKGYRACDTELSLPKPSYTYRTLQTLTNKHPDRRFVLIMGGDNISGFNKWKNAAWIAQNFEIYVYPRPGHQNLPSGLSNARMVNAPLIEISATQIRQAISRGKDMHFFLHPAVDQYIKQKGLYK